MNNPKKYICKHPIHMFVLVSALITLILSKVVFDRKNNVEVKNADDQLGSDASVCINNS